MYQKNPLLEFTAVELGLVPAITTPLGAGAGAIVGDVTGRIKSRKIEDEDEKKKNIKKYRNKGIKYGALGGLGVGLTPAAILAGGLTLDKIKKAKALKKQIKIQNLNSYVSRFENIQTKEELDKLSSELAGAMIHGKVPYKRGMDLMQKIVNWKV